jgi:hypothetical protein
MHPTPNIKALRESLASGIDGHLELVRIESGLVSTPVSLERTRELSVADLMLEITDLEHELSEALAIIAAAAAHSDLGAKLAERRILLRFLDEVRELSGQGEELLTPMLDSALNTADTYRELLRGGS